MKWSSFRPNFFALGQILLFRRPLGTDPTTGEVNEELAKQQREEFMKQYRDGSNN